MGSFRREIFFGLQSFSFYDRTELVLACGPSHQSQVCRCSCSLRTIRIRIRNPQSSSALASAVAACRCRCHHVHCISLSTWHPACNFLVVKLCFAFVFAFACVFAFALTCTEIINKTSELLARWCVLGFSCSCSLGFSFGFVCGFASVWPKWAKAKQKLK